MFEEAQLYSPVTKDESGKVVVHLGEDHPGFNDPEYRERRNAIAHASMDYKKGDPVPVVEYTDAENEVWRTVCRELPAKHAKYACRAYNEAVAALDLPRDHIPQLAEVSARLQPLTGWSYVPAPAPGRDLRPPPRPRRAARVPCLAGREGVPLDAVHPPLRRAALHARARPDPRGHRPRQHAGSPGLRGGQRTGRPRRPARRDAGGASVPGRLLLVHDGVRSRLRGR